MVMVMAIAKGEHTGIGGGFMILYRWINDHVALEQAHLLNILNTGNLFGFINAKKFQETVLGNISIERIDDVGDGGGEYVWQQRLRR